MSKNKRNTPRPETGASAAASSRREELRRQQEAEAKKQQQKRILTVAICVVLAVVLAVIVGFVIHSQQQKKLAEQRAQGVGPQITPAAANDAKNAITSHKDKWDNKKPLVQAFEDPQCPGCAQVAQSVDPMLEKLVERGEIRLQYHVLIGLDRAFPGQHSYRGSIALACAADVGKFEPYHLALYKGQPAREGDGWTDEQLRNTWAAEAGITGDQLKKFQSCFDEKKTHDFVLKMTNDRPQIVTSTPTFVVNNKIVQLRPADMVSEDALLAAIQRYV